jgi:hypothetical protein
VLFFGNGTVRGGKTVVLDKAVELRDSVFSPEDTESAEKRREELPRIKQRFLGLKTKAFNHRGHEEEQGQQKLKARGEGVRD